MDGCQTWKEYGLKRVLLTNVGANLRLKADPKFQNLMSTIVNAEQQIMA